MLGPQVSTSSPIIRSALIYKRVFWWPENTIESLLDSFNTDTSVPERRITWSIDVGIFPCLQVLAWFQFPSSLLAVVALHTCTSPFLHVICNAWHVYCEGGKKVIKQIAMCLVGAFKPRARIS